MRRTRRVSLSVIMLPCVRAGSMEGGGGVSIKKKSKKTCNMYTTETNRAQNYQVEE